MRPTTLLLLLLSLTLFVMGKTQRVGDECNWKLNCQSSASGVGPDWANGEITCAIPASNQPETCGAQDPNKHNFYGTCKAVGTLKQDEYACPCGVHGVKCPAFSSVSRLFWPQDWLSKPLAALFN